MNPHMGIPVGIPTEILWAWGGYGNRNSTGYLSEVGYHRMGCAAVILNEIVVDIRRKFPKWGRWRSVI